MLQFYSFPSPNCLKVAIMLEECGLRYEHRYVDILNGGQFDPDFLATSPNNKVPALVDPDAPAGSVTLFESGAILEYLAEKTARFCEAEARWDVRQWLYWQMAGLGPMAGQAHHFRKFAPEHVPYAIKRYTDEMNRLYGVLNVQLERRNYIADNISIADFACWPWVRHCEWQGQALEDFPHVMRWFETIEKREAVQRAVSLGAEKMAPKDSYRYLYGQTAGAAEGVQKERQRS